MALAALRAGAAERHALIQQHVVADLGGFADHHAHTVIDKKPATDAGAGMDLDSGEKARQLRDQARNKGNARAPQAVGETMKQNRVQPRVEQHFPDISGGRIVTENSANVVAQYCER